MRECGTFPLFPFLSLVLIGHANLHQNNKFWWDLSKFPHFVTVASEKKMLTYEYDVEHVVMTTTSYHMVHCIRWAKQEALEFTNCHNWNGIMDRVWQFCLEMSYQWPLPTSIAHFGAMLSFLLLQGMWRSYLRKSLKNYSKNLYWVLLAMSGIQTLVVIGTDCIGSCKSTNMTASPRQISVINLLRFRIILRVIWPLHVYIYISTK